ncbi:hypothetical protein PanWU01x14_227550 [Parasponia andersonii]|uniref:Uncharacterized protein n=1 Tax=Parasponia andersonii TaxID=3476 RepID=A0A2P5BM43_PARAD|nr:hypothetical protein PanWU01x14_227550 [Parasponia andersonii]
MNISDRKKFPPLILKIMKNPALIRYLLLFNSNFTIIIWCRLLHLCGQSCQANAAQAISTTIQATSPQKPSPRRSFCPSHIDHRPSKHGVHWYAHSKEVGKDSDDEEAQSLIRGKPDGDLSLVKQEKKKKKVRDEESYDEKDNSEEDKKA